MTTRATTRLMNLGLGLAALLSFGPPDIWPSRWVFERWLTATSLETVAGPIKVMAHVGINLWLPAAALVLLFVLLRLHRKVDAPKSRLASWALALSWLGAISLSVGTHILAEEYGGSDAGESGALGLMVGLVLLPVIALLVLSSIFGAVSEFAVMRRAPPAASRVPASLFFLAIAPPLLLVMPLVFAPSNPIAISREENSEFRALCEDAGVRLLAIPAAPVRSIAYDWDPARIQMRPVDNYGVNAQDRMVRGASSDGPRALTKGNERYEIDFIESRHDNWCSASVGSFLPYARCSNWRDNLPSAAIDAFTADVLVYYDVDKPDAYRSTNTHGAVQFELTVTERRSGARLGEMHYVVDLANRRACGANFGHLISHDAFIWDAIDR